MDISILKRATTRRSGFRGWKDIHAGNCVGTIRYGYGILIPSRKGEALFMWDFHPHPGGQGGLDRAYHREEIRDRAQALIRRNSGQGPSTI